MVSSWKGKVVGAWNFWTCAPMRRLSMATTGSVGPDASGSEDLSIMKVPTARETEACRLYS